MVDTVRVAQQYVEVIEVGLANPPVRVVQQYVEVIESDEESAPGGTMIAGPHQITIVIG